MEQRVMLGFIDAVYRCNIITAVVVDMRPTCFMDIRIHMPKLSDFIHEQIIQAWLKYSGQSENQIHCMIGLGVVIDLS